MTSKAGSIQLDHGAERHPGCVLHQKLTAFSQVTFDNVIQLINLADFYQDLTLGRECRKFIVRNYDNVRVKKEYQTVEKETKKKIKNEYEKYYKKEKSKKA